RDTSVRAECGRHCTGTSHLPREELLHGAPWSALACRPLQSPALRRRRGQWDALIRRSRLGAGTDPAQPQRSVDRTDEITPDCTHDRRRGGPFPRYRPGRIRTSLRGVLRIDSVAALPRNARSRRVRSHLAGRVPIRQGPIRTGGGRRGRLRSNGVGPRLPPAARSGDAAQSAPDVRIGFFNHLPFPPKELFAQLPSRTAIAEGMLRADVIGFQLDSDAQNFRSCALAFSDIDVDRSETVLDSFPMSIDVPAIHDCAESPTTALQARELRAQFGAPETLLLGIDRLEHTKGILQRLLAYEELLEEGALDPRSTTLVQTAVPAEDEPPTQTELRDEAEQLVGRINGRFGTLATTVIHYCHRSYSFETLVALYLAADVLLATSLRDGMNLIAKEYVAARRGRSGVLVLSEFAGSAGELTQALSVNPHDADALKHQMSEAVHMPAETAR